MQTSACLPLNPTPSSIFLQSTNLHLTYRVSQGRLYFTAKTDFKSQWLDETEVYVWLMLLVQPGLVVKLYQLHGGMPLITEPTETCGHSGHGWWEKGVPRELCTLTHMLWPWSAHSSLPRTSHMPLLVPGILGSVGQHTEHLVSITVSPTHTMYFTCLVFFPYAQPDNKLQADRFSTSLFFSLLRCLEQYLRQQTG